MSFEVSSGSVNAVVVGKRRVEEKEGEGARRSESTNVDAKKIHRMG